jgi:hypothetical protein
MILSGLQRGKSRLCLTKKTLFAWANKGFNYVRRQQGCLHNRHLLVSVFYDDFKEKIYASTIPRGLFEDRMQNMEEGSRTEDVARVWRRWKHKQSARGQEAMHAEDGAYWFAEVIDPFESENPELPPYGNPANRLGSKIATWGVWASNSIDIVNEPGQPIALCPYCKSLANDMGVYRAWPTGEKRPVAYVDPPKQVPTDAPRAGPDSFWDDDFFDSIGDKFLDQPPTGPENRPNPDGSVDNSPDKKQPGDESDDSMGDIPDEIWNRPPPQMRQI